MRDLIYIIQLVLFALSVIMFVSFGLALSDKNKFYKCYFISRNIMINTENYNL